MGAPPEVVARLAASRQEFLARQRASMAGRDVIKDPELDQFMVNRFLQYFPAFFLSPSSLKIVFFFFVGCDVMMSIIENFRKHIMTC